MCRNTKNNGVLIIRKIYFTIFFGNVQTVLLKKVVKSKVFVTNIICGKMISVLGNF